MSVSSARAPLHPPCIQCYPLPSIENPLASGFSLRDGSVRVTCPTVSPGNDYIVVRKHVFLTQNVLPSDTPFSIWRFGKCKPSVHYLRSKCESKLRIRDFSEFGCVAKHSTFSHLVYHIGAYVTHDHNIVLGSPGTVLDDVIVGQCASSQLSSHRTQRLKHIPIQGIR
jgi:hypothetical protein